MCIPTKRQNFNVFENKKKIFVKLQTKIELNYGDLIHNIYIDEMCEMNKMKNKK